MWITNVIVKLPRLVLQVEMSWYHSLALSVGQYVVTLLSELEDCRLNMDVLYVSTSGPSIHLCKGMLCLCWDANWEIPLYLLELPIDSSTLGVANHHSGCCLRVGTRVGTRGKHD